MPPRGGTTVGGRGSGRISRRAQNEKARAMADFFSEGELRSSY